jgi:hypothetical protein
MDYPSLYTQLGFKLVRLRPGTKIPVDPSWQVNQESDDIPKNYGIGLKHAFSRVCCFDIDDLDLFIGKHAEAWELIRKGLMYTSGKPNRVKALFRLPKSGAVKGIDIITKTFIPSGAGQFRCATETGGSTQDVLPPTRLADGRKYKWISPLPTRWEDIPVLPESIYIDLKLGERATRSGRSGSRYTGKYLAPYVIGYNRWFAASGGSLEKEILNTNGYYPVKYGFNRHGSVSGSINIVLHSDEHGEWGYNFSDAEPISGRAIPAGAFDPYDLLVINNGGDEKEARRIVTATVPEIKEFVDSEYFVKTDTNIAKITKDKHKSKKEKKACQKELKNHLPEFLKSLLKY